MSFKGEPWTQTRNWGDMSPELMKAPERAKREQSAQFHSFAHHLNVAALECAYHRQRADAATGVDGATKEAYGMRLEDNLRTCTRAFATSGTVYRPILRVHIEKEGGGTRPLGISVLEDKLVQDALRKILSTVHEQDCLDCSFRFRPGRSAHDAIRALHGTASRKGAHGILIRSFFDTVPQQRLLEMIRKRVSDGALLRLVGKYLRAGVLEGEQLTSSAVGTPQGSVLSPLLANIDLHHVLDITYDFLGFTFYWRRACDGRWVNGGKTLMLERYPLPRPYLTVRIWTP